MRDRQLRAAGAVGERTHEVAKGLRSLHARGRYHLSRIWDDWISSMALALANGVDHRPEKHAAREAEYMAIVKAHGPAVMVEFKRLFHLLVEELEEQRTDVLGQMLMALELGSDHAGQYFTPPDVCAVMARMTLSAGDAQRIVAENGYISVQEPAIGGGAMVYPLIDVLLEAGLNPSQHLHVTGIDIDVHVLRIAYVQLSLLGVPAVLYVGDTLRMEMRDDYYTFAHIVNGWGPRLRRRAEVGAIAAAVGKARELLDAVVAESEPEPIEIDGPEYSEPEPDPKPGQLGLFG